MANSGDIEQGGVSERTQSSDRKGAYCPLLDKETLLEHLPSITMSTLLGVTAINVLSSNQSFSGDTNKHKGLRQFLLAVPYTLFLFAVAGLAVAFAVKRNTRMLGFAAGSLLAQLVCLIVMGGIVTLVRGEVDPRIVWPVTGGIIICVLVIWSVMCAYPKWLRFFHCCCDAKEKKCQRCGGTTTVNGTSANPAGDGADRCPSCGGIAPASVAS